MDKNHQFFCHKACEFFPCHKTEHPDDFNCLFCYCPLYAYGEQCGGSFCYTDGGIKDCSNCLVPHRKDSFAVITARLAKLAGEK